MESIRVSLPRLVATGVGSLPGLDAENAVRRILRAFPDLPYWPQFPAAGLDEIMLWQFLPPVPKRPAQTPWAGQTGLGPDEMEAWLTGDLAGTETPMDRAMGLVEMERALGPSAASVAEEERSNDVRSVPTAADPAQHGGWIKGQLTGPVTLALNLRDNTNTPLFERPRLLGVLLDRLVAAGRAQISRLRRLRPNVLLVIDEPALFRLERTALPALAGCLESLIAALRSPGVAIGVHTCGPPPWQLLAALDADMVNFDALRFPPNHVERVGPLTRFLQAGGRLAWGIVPTERPIPCSVLGARTLELMADFGRTLARSSLLTPTCGLALLGDSGAEAVERCLNETRATLITELDKH